MSLIKQQENKGKPCVYKEKKCYVVYIAENFILISKKKNLSKAFSVNPNEITINE